MTKDVKKTITSNCGRYHILVDEEDYDRVVEFAPNGWEARYFTKSNYPYAITRKTINGKRVQFFMHRIILEITDANVHIDHKDRNGLNNRKFNLRMSTRSENMKNRKSAKNSTSKHLGVHFCNEQYKWRATIKPTGQKNINLGRYEKEIDAAYAYNFSATIIHGNFSNFNKIDTPVGFDFIEKKVSAYINKRNSND